MFYAGIGSRQTPPWALALMADAAARLEAQGWILRSGNAPGADQAFARRTRRAHIFLPWPSFHRDALPASAEVYDAPTIAARELTARFHPAWDQLRPAVRALHARNAHQVLGRELDQPAAFVLCWTPQGHGGGGTGQALRIAAAYGIPCFDLARSEHLTRIRAMLDT